LDKTVAMLNFDMIGHLREGPLTIVGLSSAKSFDDMVQRLGADEPFDVKSANVKGASDHVAFRGKGIPYLFFHTGVTRTYHTPDDDFHTLDLTGVVEVIDFAEEIVDELLRTSISPVFVDADHRSSSRRVSAYLGIVPEYVGQNREGVTCAQVKPDSPAAKGNLKPGDVIVRIGDVQVSDEDGLIDALQQHEPGDEVQIIVRRGEQERSLSVTLGTLQR